MYYASAVHLNNFKFQTIELDIRIKSDKSDRNVLLKRGQCMLKTKAHSQEVQYLMRQHVSKFYPVGMISILKHSETLINADENRNHI